MNKALAIRLPVGVVALPDNKQWVNRFEILSETSNRIYVVAQRRTTGEWGCSCPGWRAHRHCKHLRAIAPERLLKERAA